MKSVSTCAAAAALAVVASVGASPAYASEQAPSAFVQCDGRTGHVSDGARLMRVLLVTATAGISEAAMAHDNADKRAKGAAGVAACDQAIASEGDAYRRVQLGFAKAMHYAEDSKWVEAAAAARAAPSLSTRADWGLNKSATAVARYLEALFLARAGKTAEAEAAAWDGVSAADLDVVTMQRMLRFGELSRTMTPAKRAALLKTARYYPISAMQVANELAAAGDFDSAIAAARGLDATIDAVVDKRDPIASVPAAISSYAALKGDSATAHAELQKAKDALEAMRAKGDPVSDANSFARSEEWVAFAAAATASADGDSARAAEALAARGSWPSIAPELVATLVGQVAAKVPDEQRRGIVAEGEDAIWADSVKARVAALSNTDNDDKLWSTIALLEQDEGYQHLARNALTGSTAKPKWLLKPDKKKPVRFEILTTSPSPMGWEDGEALLYHAALIARTRGKQGFIVLPTRKQIDALGIRFLNAGEEGVPAQSMIMADEVIADLSPHFVSTTN